MIEDLAGSMASSSNDDYKLDQYEGNNRSMSGFDDQIGIERPGRTRLWSNASSEGGHGGDDMG